MSEQRPKLGLVPSPAVDVEMAIKANPRLKIQEDIVAIHKNFRHSVPGDINQLPSVDGLAPKSGMVMSRGECTTNRAVDAPVVHIDKVFLETSATGLKPHLQAKVARYFIVSTAAHSYTYDAAPVMAENALNGRDIALRSAWRWAGAIALERMHLLHTDREKIIGHVSEAAELLDAQSPKPWHAIGSPAFPEQWHTDNTSA
jgi:hypothetical protein